MAEIKLTSENFEEIVLKSDKTVLVDFWASWCAPCMMLSHVIAEIAEETEGKVIVGKVNVDEENELSMQYGISSIPTILVFRNGKIVNAAVGLRTKEHILEMLK
ncbi:MAG: thioredoxin [Oscillospiraceae bacterium]|nr:thioredoxin [Oscillospiraceae bacterium]